MLKEGAYMWNQLLLIMIGFSAGIIIAGGEVGLLIGLSIIPRYAGITHTGKHILLYEDSILLGTVLGNLFFLWKWQIPGGLLFLILYGLFSGLFLGGWIMALAEVADIFPIFARRARFLEGLPKVILSIALGKTLGSLFYYYKEWFP